MGLGLAGMVSGLGQGLQQGLQTMNSGIVQMGVQSTLQGEDRAFQMKKLELQQQFERGMQKEKMGADRQNTLDTIAAQGKNAMDLEGARAGHTKELEGMKETAASTRLDKQLESQKSLEMVKLGVTKDIHDKDRAVLEQHYKDYATLNKDRLKLEKGEVTQMVTKEGKIALMNKRTGESLGYLLDSNKKEIIAQRDVPQSVLMEGNAIQHEIDNLTREYIKNPMRTEEQEDAHRESLKALQQRYDQLIAPYRTEGTTAAPVPAKKLNLGKFGGMNPSAGQGTVLAPAQTPTSPTKVSPGMMGAAKGLVPGLGMIENYLRK